jgi:hypothetical protein
MSFPVAMLYTATGALEVATSTTVPAFMSQTLGSTLANSQSLGYYGQELWVFCTDTAAWIKQGPTALATFSAKTFTNTGSANEITVTGHGLNTGDGPFQLTTSGTLPTGLALATNYWVVVVDANTLQLSTTLANAIAGTVVTITASTGSGTHHLNWQASSQTAAATVGPGSVFVPAGVQILIDGNNGAVFSVLANASTGHASLARVLLR